MCGRTAQTQRAVVTAASSLMDHGGGSSCTLQDDIGDRVSPADGSTGEEKNNTKTTAQHDDGAYPWHDNYNLSPGHDAVVFTMSSDHKRLKMDRKIWGLVPRGGTPKAPLPTGPSQHFANLMFNARSDTLYSKPTFARLLGQGKTCVVAVDGFFEWKSETVGKGKKQPYFVYSNETNGSGDEKEKVEESRQGGDQKSTISKRGYLLMAGLWTSIPTGRSDQPIMDTFTILTTEVCNPLSWLHTRMPVCIWDEQLAVEWLQNPTQSLLKTLDAKSHSTQEGLFRWHAVTTKMSSTKFRSAESIKALPKVKTVTSFFAPVAKGSFAKKTAGATTTPQKKNAPPDSNESGAKDKPPSDFFTNKRPAPWFSPSGSASKAAKKHTGSSTKAQQKTKDNSSAASEKKGAITSFFAVKK